MAQRLPASLGQVSTTNNSDKSLSQKVQADIGVFNSLVYFPLIPGKKCYKVIISESSMGRTDLYN